VSCGEGMRRGEMECTSARPFPDRYTYDRSLRDYLGRQADEQASRHAGDGEVA